MSDAPSVPADIIEAIRDARSKIRSIKTDEFNRHDNYAYVSIDTYYEKVATIATGCGLVWRAREKSFDLVENQGGKKDRTYVRATFAYDLFNGADAAMDYMTITIFAPVVSAQTTGQLYSYADKVFLRTTLTVPTGEKDADAEGKDDMLSPRPVSIMPPPKPYVPDPNSTGAPPPLATLPTTSISSSTQVDDLLIPDFLRRPDRPGSAPLHDDDEVIPTIDNNIAPSYSDGLPLVSLDKVNGEAIATITEIFRTFMPMVKSASKLTAWHQENVPVLERVLRIDPNAHTKIKSLFKDRYDQLSRKD